MRLLAVAILESRRCPRDRWGELAILRDLAHRLDRATAQPDAMGGERSTTALQE